MRVDAGPVIGLGHLSRCLTLASSLTARHIQVSFVCSRSEPRYYALLDAQGFRTHWIEQTDEANDASQTLAAIATEAPSAFVVDHYALGLAWERLVSETGRPRVVIDDTAERRHECEILVDPNLHPEPTPYAGKVLPETQLLLGPDFALIKPIYRRVARVRGQTVSQPRIIVYFGGTDPYGLAPLTAEALSQQQFAHTRVDLVLPPLTYKADVQQLREQFPTCNFIEGGANLVDLVDAAELAIGAGGVATWERLCAGLPSLLTAVADNQVVSSRRLGHLQVADYLGPADAISAQLLAERTLTLLRSSRRREAMSRAGMSLVDGLGSERVADMIYQTLIQ